LEIVKSRTLAWIAGGVALLLLASRANAATAASAGAASGGGFADLYGAGAGGGVFSGLTGGASGVAAAPAATSEQNVQQAYSYVAPTLAPVAPQITTSVYNTDPVTSALGTTYTAPAYTAPAPEPSYSYLPRYMDPTISPGDAGGA
jgi:hypothetical protein